MFSVNQIRLIESLEELRKNLCHYGPGAKTCDCKFISNDNPYGKGERSGCPEIRTAISILSNLTSEEYDIMAQRGDLTIFPFDEEDS